ncbi:MAG TPA: glycosyltransferase family 4 protein [Gemmatimonadales bacterium]|nr:glycosyltransferase family 4 protein [Gemmatimonadales bacterium]
MSGGPSARDGSPARLRVGLLITARGWRGSGEAFGKIARALADRGHETCLVTASSVVTERLAAAGLPVRRLELRHTGLAEARRLYAFLGRFRPDALLADSERDLRLAALASLLPYRLVYRYNVTTPRARVHVGNRLALRRVAAVVFQSAYLEEKALRHVPGLARPPRYRIPNGFDVKRFAPAPAAGAAFRRAWGIPGEAAVALTSAQFFPEKNHELVFRALRHGIPIDRPLVYVLCGMGPLEDRLRAAAAGLPVRTVFTGQLPSDELVGALNAADVVVHPCAVESFPNAVGEAMGCGRAIVGIDAGGTPELLGRGGDTGVLVPPDDPAALAGALGELLADPARRERLGTAARARLVAGFSLERMGERYEAMLRDVVDPP